MPRMLRVCRVFRARACMLCSVLLSSLLVSVGRPSFFCALAAALLFLPSSRLLPLCEVGYAVFVFVFLPVFFPSPFFFRLCLLMIMVSLYVLSFIWLLVVYVLLCFLLLVTFWLFSCPLPHSFFPTFLSSSSFSSALCPSSSSSSSLLSALLPQQWSANQRTP